MSWLVTGAAGYIGAHVVRAFRAADIDVVALDNLSSGIRSFVPEDVPFEHVDVLDTEGVHRVIVDHHVTGVVHLAAFKYAGESVRRPLHTWRQNLGGTLSLLDATDATAVSAFVFSSTAAVYGTPATEVVTESTPTAPASPYGESKLAAERLIADVASAARAHSQPFAWTALRYFNVVGSGTPDVWDASPHNLFPLVLGAIARGEAPRINGDDFPTPDGTCVRDYIHVADLARAHVEAARRLADGQALEPIYNLGSGQGTSVREIVDACLRVTGSPLTARVQGRRPGDPARIVAAGDLARRDLGWQMTHSIDDMVASAWAAHPRDP